MSLVGWTLMLILIMGMIDWFYVLCTGQTTNEFSGSMKQHRKTACANPPLLLLETELQESDF
jgi:hypothetical protein